VGILEATVVQIVIGLNTKWHLYLWTHRCSGKQYKIVLWFTYDFSYKIFWLESSVHSFTTF